MMKKRTFLKIALGAFSGVMLGRNTTAQAASAQNPWAGLVYTTKSSGKWKGKAGSHAPTVEKKGDKITIATPHGMSTNHFIVRHTVVATDGTVLGEKTFQPSDTPMSEFVLPPETQGTLYVTSFCNKHDLWVTAFSA